MKVHKVLGLVMLLGLMLPGRSSALDGKPSPDRDFLWKLVDNCLENNPNYCANCPKPPPDRVASCNPASLGWDELTRCRQTTVIWNVVPKFVAIMDYKMCGCVDKSFVHGLALPRARVTGVEDAGHRVEGIWQFAWEEALKKIKAKEDIVLAANPRGRRTQDHFHIHLVRLAPGARKKLDALSPRRVKNLGDVWAAADSHAAAAGLAPGTYGIAVAHQADGAQFLVVATTDSPEGLLTVHHCSQ